MGPGNTHPTPVAAQHKPFPKEELCYVGAMAHKRIGRPRISNRSKLKSASLIANCTPSARRLAERAARRAQLSLTEWLRRVVLKAAERELRRS